MKSADEYAALAIGALRDAAEAYESDHDRLAPLHLGAAGVHATLALAAATLEAARLMGPTPEDHARLDALVPKVSAYCTTEWPLGDNDLAFQSCVRTGQHRCIYLPGHEKDDPHYCVCGSEMTPKAEDPSEADIDAFMGAIENPDANLCPGCGCTANVEHADGFVCEEYPGCSALMESPK